MIAYNYKITYFIALFILIISTFFKFDISDDGFYLSLLVNGENVIWGGIYHLFLNSFGDLISNSVLFYRLLSILLIIFSTNILIKILLNLKLIPNKTNAIYLVNLAAILSLTSLITLNYNCLIVVSNLLLLSSLLSYKTNNVIQSFFLLLASLLIGAVSRPTSLIINVILILAVFIYYWRINISLIKLKTSSLVLAIVLVLFFYFLLIKDYKNSFELMNLMSQSSHKNLLTHYFKNGLWDIIRLSFLIPIFIFLKTNRLKFFIIIIIGIIIMFLMSRIAFLKYVSFNLLLVNIIIIKKTWLKDKNKLFFTILCTIMALVSSLGTNVSLLSHSYFSLMLLVLPSINNIKFLKESAIIYTLSILSFVILIKYQYVSPYRSGSILLQNTLSKHSKPLKYIHLEKQFSESIDNLYLTLQDLKFDKQKDLILSYPDNPGYASSLEIKSYGSPWNFSGYENINIVNCFHLNKRDKSSEVYFLLEKEIPEELKSCLSIYLKEKPDFFKEKVIYRNTKSYRNNEKNLTLILRGPYIFY